jgi:hypothetical protein
LRGQRLENGGLRRLALRNHSRNSEQKCRETNIIAEFFLFGEGKTEWERIRHALQPD